MNWLKENAHLATWLSPIIALLGIIVQGTAVGHIDWNHAMLYICFLTCLAAMMSPALDEMPRLDSMFIVIGLLLFFGTEVARQWK
jgi:predicted membrane channel-forming protein YqfA (hemolysin III family)